MVTRLSGLASGFDTETTVKKLMAAARLPLDKLNQKKQLLQWQRDDYRTLNAKILDLRSAASDMKLPSKYQVKTGSSADDSAVSVTAGSAANEGIYKIKVTKLATTASVTSDKLGVGSDSKVLGDGGLGLTLGTTLDVTDAKGNIVHIDLKPEDTIAQFVTNFNGKSSATGVKVSYDATMDRLFFLASSTGEKSKFTLEVGGGSGPDIFKLKEPTTPAPILGEDAIISFNGIDATYSSNNFTINGMNFTAKKAQATTDTAVNITVGQDTDTIFNSIKSFVEKYNALIDTINTKTGEKKYRDYQPLSDEQKTNMKEDDIKNWNAKAMSGMLSNDQILTSGLSNFRTALSGSVKDLPAGQLNNLAGIGISSSVLSGTSVSGSYLDKGKLYIDETKLKAAISDNPDQISKLFLANDNKPNTDEGDGIAVRMYDQANKLFNQISNKAGLTTSVQNTYILGKSLIDIDKQVDTFTTRLEALETRYYKQFTAMETYINNMNTQSANLTKQFG